MTKRLKHLKGLVEDGFNKTFNDKEAFGKVYQFVGESKYCHGLSLSKLSRALLKN